MLLSYFLKRLIRQGTLLVRTADGRSRSFGRGKPHVAIRLHNRSLEWSLPVWPDLKIGEAYMQGLLTVEQGSLGAFLELMMVNYVAVRQQRFFRWLEYISGRASAARQYNPVGRARRNVAAHYDLPDDLYDVFLDRDRQYSCAYFTAPGNSLDQAQLDKKRHIAAKLYLDRPGLKVLDIGSGWGGMALYLAAETAARVTGVTLSTHQYRISRERAQAAGLDQSCRFELRDYRQETGPYDRIVSVGMFEHVGKKNYDEFFAQIRRLLAEDGVCLLHSITSFEPPRAANAFIRKYIFPGGDIPSLSETTAAIERAGLFVTDVEILRLHYAETLKQWHQRFRARRADVVARYGEVFYRKWEFYLVGCETAFRHNGLMVAQVQLTRRLETLPITRDYMPETEQALQLQELAERRIANAAGRREYSRR